MRPIHRILLLATLFLSRASLLAQPAADPSGHWEGTIQAPNMAVSIEIDLARNGQGDFVGTFGQPAQGVKGLPLSTVAVEAQKIRFVVKGGPEAATFDGTVSADGRSISGSVTQGGFAIPMDLARTGDARIAPPPKSAPIGKELEGTWSGTLDVNGQQMRLVVKMANQPDGTAAGTVVSPDGSGVDIPITMAQKASSVTIEVPSVGASFVAVLNAERTELTGTWTQGPSALPLTLKLGR